MPFSTIRFPKSPITNLQFCSIPQDVVPTSPTITRDPRRPVKEGAPEKGSLYLVASSLNFDECEETSLFMVCYQC